MAETIVTWIGVGLTAVMGLALTALTVLGIIVLIKTIKDM